MVDENSDNISVLSDGKLTFVLNIIIIIILAPASTLSAGYCNENENYGFARGSSGPVVKNFFLLGTECVVECYRIPHSLSAKRLLLSLLLLLLLLSYSVILLLLLSFIIINLSSVIRNKCREQKSPELE